MNIIFKAAHIGFALRTIWDFTLGQTNEGTAFKAQLMEKFKQVADPEDDVTVEVSADILMQCFAAVRNSPYGYTNALADDMKLSLVAQVWEQSNNDDENPNEAYKAMKRIIATGEDDERMTLAFVNEGIQKIKA